MRGLSICLLLASLAGCGSTDTNPSPEPERLEFDLAPKIDVGGHTLGTRFDIRGSTRQKHAIEAWFVEAVGQSPWLDIDTGGERKEMIIVRGEIGADGQYSMTTTYAAEGETLLPLAGVRGGDGDVPTAIDRLARETRRTLGEPMDSIRRYGRPCNALVSASESVAAACADARRLVRNRRLTTADATLRRALRVDPACALALSLSAGVRMDQGHASRAVELATRAKRLATRASPQAMHRADRVLLLATRADYDELVTLAEREAKARPHDPQVRFTKALGLCMLGRYDDALPLLQQLRKRMPDSPGVLFCLGHALLGTGRATDAKAVLPDIEARVPPLPAGRLGAWIWLALGDHEQLEEHFEQLARRGIMRLPEGELTMLQMRAAHALLRDQDKVAGDLLIEQLDRLRASPSLLAKRGAMLVDSAWVLARLGRGADCSRMLALVRGKTGMPEPARAPGMAADAICTFATGGRPAAKNLAHLERVGLAAWRHRIEAAIALRAGNPARALLSVEEAMRTSDDPALALEYAEVLTAVGRVEESNKLRKALAARLIVPQMSAPARHVLIRPKLAMVHRLASR